MPKWLKIVLVAVAALILICGLGIGATTWLVKSKSGDLKALGEKAQKKGEEIAARTNAEGCVVETLAALKVESGILASIEGSVVLQACLNASDLPKTFCDGVPGDDTILEQAAWVRDECARRGESGDNCHTVLKMVPKVCHRNE